MEQLSNWKGESANEMAITKLLDELDGHLNMSCRMMRYCGLDLSEVEKAEAYLVIVKKKVQKLTQIVGSF